MKNYAENSEPEKSEIEEIDVWPSIVTTPEDSIIRLSQNHSKNHKILAEEVDA